MEDEAKCIVCLSKLNKGARKCVKCGSYQSWVRYLDFGNSTLALSVAAISLVTSFTTAAFVSMEYFKSASRRGVAVKVLSIDNSRLSIFVRNNTDDDVIISDVGCLVYFPKDGTKQIRAGMAARETSGSIKYEELLLKDTLNPFILTYKSEPSVVETNTGKMVELSLTSSVVVLPEDVAESPAVNICALENLGLGEGKNAWVFQPPRLFYTEFGILALIEKTIFDASSNTNALKMKSELTGYTQ